MSITGCLPTIKVTFDCYCIHIVSDKDLSNVVLLFDNDVTQKFDNLSGLSGTFCGTKDNYLKYLIGAWVKSGCNLSGDCDGCGEFFISNILRESCDSCCDGCQGVQGSIGTQGVQGLQGRQGSQGVQGSQGSQGSIGNQGVQGVQGIGTQGNVGVQGYQGSTATVPIMYAWSDNSCADRPTYLKVAGGTSNYYGYVMPFRGYIATITYSIGAIPSIGTSRLLQMLINNIPVANTNINNASPNTGYSTGLSIPFVAGDTLNINSIADGILPYGSGQRLIATIGVIYLIP